MEKSPDAFRTISEVADLLEVPAHVLRFWESRFTQIRPVKRAGGRRYYRPTDVALLAGIRLLLHDRGLTIRGVQKILREQGVRHVCALADQGLATEAQQEWSEEEASVLPARAEPEERVIPWPGPRRGDAAWPESPPEEIDADTALQPDPGDMVAETGDLPGQAEPADDSPAPVDVPGRDDPAAASSRMQAAEETGIPPRFDAVEPAPEIAASPEEVDVVPVQDTIPAFMAEASAGGLSPADPGPPLASGDGMEPREIPEPGWEAPELGDAVRSEGDPTLEDGIAGPQDPAAASDVPDAGSDAGPDPVPPPAADAGPRAAEPEPAPPPGHIFEGLPLFMQPPAPVPVRIRPGPLFGSSEPEGPGHELILFASRVQRLSRPVRDPDGLRGIVHRLRLLRDRIDRAHPTRE